MPQKYSPPQRPPVFRPEMPPPAPTLVGGDNRCSDCNVRSILIANDELRVCPRCHALLWHKDWSAADRERRATQEAVRKAEEMELRRSRIEAREILQARKHKVTLAGENLTTSKPEIGEPELKNNE